ALAPFRTGSATLPQTLAASLPPTPPKAQSDTEPLDVIPVGPAPRPRLKRPQAPEATPRKGRSLLGCLLIATLVVLSITGLVAFTIYLVVDKVSHGVSQFWEEAAKQNRSWDNVEKNFSPPAADIADDKLFPAKLGDYELVGVNSAVDAPEL